MYCAAWAHDSALLKNPKYRDERQDSTEPTIKFSRSQFFHYTSPRHRQPRSLRKTLQLLHQRSSSCCFSHFLSVFLGSKSLPMLSWTPLRVPCRAFFGRRKSYLFSPHIPRWVFPPSEGISACPPTSSPCENSRCSGRWDEYWIGTWLATTFRPCRRRGSSRYRKRRTGRALPLRGQGLSRGKIPPPPHVDRILTFWRLFTPQICVLGHKSPCLSREIVNPEWEPGALRRLFVKMLQGIQDRRLPCHAPKYTCERPLLTQAYLPAASYNCKTDSICAHKSHITSFELNMGTRVDFSLWYGCPFLLRKESRLLRHHTRTCVCTCFMFLRVMQYKFSVQDPRQHL